LPKHIDVFFAEYPEFPQRPDRAGHPDNFCKAYGMANADTGVETRDTKVSSRLGNKAVYSMAVKQLYEKGFSILTTSL
jgi:hypothetical protein